MQITASGTYTDIDCETMDAHEGTTNKNDKIEGSFFTLPPGSTRVQKTSGISKVEVWPRWWRL